MRFVLLALSDIVQPWRIYLKISPGPGIAQTPYFIVIVNPARGTWGCVKRSPAPGTRMESVTVSRRRDVFKALRTNIANLAAAIRVYVVAQASSILHSICLLDYVCLIVSGIKFSYPQRAIILF